MAPKPSVGPVPGLGYSDALTRRPMVRLSDAPSTPDEAAVAEEVPVAFVYNNDSFVVVMASPADLEDLGGGFSLTEGIVASAREIKRVEIVKHSRGVEIQMTIPTAAFDRLGARRRG